MAQTQHTPGPWESDGQFITAPDANGVHTDIYIAEIIREDDEDRLALPEQQEANGCLLAAAPALLAALRQAVAALNTAPRFLVPSLLTDSYAIAAACDRAIREAQP